MFNYTSAPYMLFDVEIQSWLHHLDFDKTPREKYRPELPKDAAWRFEIILKADSYKKDVV